MKKLFISLLLVTLIIPIGCKKTSQKETGVSEKANAKEESVFVWNIYTEPEYLDPTLAADSSAGPVVDNLFTGLTEHAPDTLEPRPSIAKSWDISPDGKTYIFHLRDDAKWSDGSPLTAEDFVYSWRRAASPATASKYAYMLFYIKNAKAINAGKITDLSKLGVTATDNYTLKVELENPTPFFLSIVAWHTLFPVKKEVVLKYGKKWTRPENMITNGYFKLVEWTPSKQIVIIPNPHYWARDKIFLDKVIFAMIEDQETALKSFLSGEINYMNQVPPIKVPSLRNNPEFKEASELSTYYLTLNTKRKPLDNKLVRQALAYALDRSQIVKVANMGLASASFIPRGVAGYEPAEGLKYDPIKAKALLKEAGYDNPKALPPITMIYNTSENHKMIMQVVQNMWKKNLGIDVALINMEWKILLKTRSSMDFDIARDGWVGDYVDPNTFLDLFVTGSGMNFTGWSDPKFDELIATAAKTTGNKTRYKYYNEAEKILLDDEPVIPLFTYTRPQMTSKRLSGFYANLQDIHPLKGVKISAE